MPLQVGEVDGNRVQPQRVPPKHIGAQTHREKRESSISTSVVSRFASRVLKPTAAFVTPSMKASQRFW